MTAYIPQRVFFDRTGVSIQDPLTGRREIYQRSTTPPSTGAPAGRAAARSLPSNYRPSPVALSVAAPQPANRPQILYLDRQGSQIRNPVTGRTTQESRADPRSPGATSANPPQQASTTRRARPVSVSPSPSQANRPLQTPRAPAGRAATNGTAGLYGVGAAASVLLQGGSPSQAIGVGAGVTVGAVAGQYAGTFAGAAIGGMLGGPPGALLGGKIGGTAGSILGGVLGGNLGGALSGLLGSPREGSTPVDGPGVTAPNIPGQLPEPGQFPGGQGYGVLYRVCAEGIRAGGPDKGQLGGEVCAARRSAVFGPIVGIRNFEGTWEQWRPISSHPHYASSGGLVAPGAAFNAYSAEIGSVRITRLIRLDGISEQADRDMHGDPPGTPGVSPATPRPVPPAAPPPAPLWGGSAAPTAPSPSFPSPQGTPTPAPRPNGAPSPLPPAPRPVPVGKPPPETAPPPDPAVVPAGLGDTAPAPVPSSQPSPTESIGSGATRADVPASTPASDRPITTYDENGIPTTTYPDGSQVRGSFIRGGEIVRTQVNGQTIGERVIPRGLNPGVVITTGVGLAVGTGIALTRGLSRGPSAAVGTALNPHVGQVTNPLTNQVSQPPPAKPPTPGPVNTDCKCNAAILNKLNQIQGTELAGLGAQGGSLSAILAKLNAMQSFAEKAWKATQAQKILDVLTFIGVMHNAAFLSREVAETMSYMVGNVLNIFGIEDENGSNLDVFGWLGDTIEGFFVKVFGQDLVDDARETWKKASAILRSASMIIWTVRSIFDGAQEIMEWSAENIGLIGNALKRWGVVGFNSYGWMATRMNSQDRVRRRYKRILDGLEQAEDASSSFAMATGDVREITDEVQELGEQRQAFQDSVRDLTEGAEPDNSGIPLVGDESIANAQTAPEVSATDMERGEPQ